MPVPCFRTSPTRSAKRRSHQAIKQKNIVVCPNCGIAKLPHRACSACGYVRPGLKVRTTEDI